MERIHQPAAESAKKDDLPTILFAEAAQAIYDRPRSLYYTTGRLGISVRARHDRTGLSQSQHRPRQALYLESRAIWDALAAPIIHGVELRLLRTMIGSLRAGLPLVSPELTNNTLSDHQFTREYSGPSLAFMRSMATLSAAAAESFVGEAESDPDHWHHPIWWAFVDQHHIFHPSEAAIRNPGRPRRNRDALDALTQFTIDANETVLALIKPALHHLPMWKSTWTNKKRLLLSIAEELSWPASAKSNLVARYMGREATDGPCPFVHEDPLNAHERIWHLDMLRPGKQDPPGYCPANPILLPPHWQDRVLIEAAYAQLYQDSGGYRHYKRPYGAASAAELRTILGLYVASELFP